MGCLTGGEGRFKRDHGKKNRKKKTWPYIKFIKLFFKVAESFYSINIILSLAKNNY